ncbi:hypothetical protein JSY36_17515 [Bacillus sp. H-16]|uniref:hypothetical protein n=1 Tax=Alteribacter salitolerans TaxID=2912333 RepID=UPI0019665FD0|nr:hypothetical protein [Alteribacter salitolerans]MBM7097535.1 hypothetical protein [Alteribacter salitolerans]
MELRVVMIGILAAVFLIGILYFFNFKKEERHKQLWLPLLAITFAFIIMRLDILNLLPLQWVFDRVPDAEFVTILVINGLCLALFIPLKIVYKATGKVSQYLSGFLRQRAQFIVKAVNFVISRVLKRLPAGYRQRLISGGKGKGTIALFYERDVKGVVLKPQWHYLSLTVFYTSGIAFLLLAGYIIALPFDWRNTAGVLLPPYPALSLLIFLETAWFLNGRRRDFKGNALSGEDVEAQVVSDQEKLFDEYKRTWPEKLLASGSSVKSNLFSRDESEYSLFNQAQSEEEKHLELILRRMKAQGIPLHEGYVDMLTSMMNEEDVIVRDPVYGDIKPFMMAGMVNRLMNHHRIVVVVRNQQAVAETLSWIEAGLKQASGLEHLWGTATVTEALQEGRAPHIIVTYVNELKKQSTITFLTGGFHGSRFDTYVFPEAETSLALYAGDLKNISLQLRERLPEEPSFWVFTQWYERIESLVRQTFRIKPEEIEAKKLHGSPAHHYLIWKLEGRNFQERLFTGLGSHRYITGEVTLGILAKRREIPNISFVNQGAVPIRESLNDLLDNREHLINIGMSGSQVRRIKRHSDIYTNYSSVPCPDHSFLLVRDVNYNLVDTLKHWWANGRISSFIHVISPPYLLRDYIAADLDNHMKTSRTISPLSVSQPHTPYGKIKPLLDLMLNGYVKEEKVKEFLASLDTGNAASLPVIKQLEDCFIHLFGASDQVVDALKVRKSRIFDEEEQCFKEQTEYNLTKRLEELISSMVSNEIKVQKQSGDVVEAIREGHLYQRYLPGQEHTFNGELCKVEKISPRLGTMDVTLTSNRRPYVYKQDRTYIFHAKDWPQQGNVVTKGTKKGQTLTIQLGELPVTVRTRGYLESMKHVDLQKGSFHTLKDSEQTLVERRFEKGKVLKVSLKLPEAIVNRNRVAFTLSFLLNELFLTLYPNLHEYLAASVPLPEDFFAGENDMIGLIHPKMNNGMPYDEAGTNELHLYLIEDSPSQLGAAESFIQNREYVFELLEDYVSWVLADVEERREYLSFGCETLSGLFDLEGTQKVLRTFMGGESLGEQRHNQHQEAEKETGSEEDYEEKTCSFCGVVFKAVYYEKTDDKRVWCIDCRESAVNYERELKPMYEKLRTFLATEFNVELRRDYLCVELKSAKDLHEANSLPFTPENPGRMVGQASLDEENNIKVMIENGAPRLQTYMTLVHELTHVWQYDNLNLTYMTLDEIEGFATWVEICLAEHFHEHTYVEWFKRQLEDRNDSYSRGYYEIMAQMKEAGVKSPFELYGVKQPA